MAMPCPCCGYLTMSDDMPDTYDICPVCFWEDDGVQYRDPTYAGGANEESLLQARENFRAFGAKSRRFIGNVRPPMPDEFPNRME
jgi:hypothetical protein